ncbi:uncharacterized protein LOC143574802 [Bidens hawaiensis]|uniref:uncharacterized protein LOC143574802 n=1 Tax=Bidens hawaiensis TaxID=980011 RepID=UPI004049EF36
MSDYIPADIQLEIMTRLPLKSLIQFRSVPKTWKSIIDSSAFISKHSLQQRTPHSGSVSLVENKYVSIIDDHTYPRQIVSLTPPPLVKKLQSPRVIGTSRGLVGLVGLYSRHYRGSTMDVVVIWNISIRKAVAVFVPNVAQELCRSTTTLGFGVCRETNDPKIVRIKQFATCNPIEVEVVIDGVIYWLAIDKNTVDGNFLSVLISFDMSSEEFGEITLPHGFNVVNLSKLGESLLVVVVQDDEAFNFDFDVWMMGDGVLKSFTKLFTFTLAKVFELGFRKDGKLMLLFIDFTSEKMEKQIGCMSGLLQIFDREHILAGKRIHSTKRLPPSTAVGGSPVSRNSGESHAFSGKPDPHKHSVVVPANADNSQSSPSKTNDRSKSFKEIHRHSLDSRINVSNTTETNRDNSQQRSPSVIARLMELEPMPSTDNKPLQTVTKPTLRRSASESRLSRDIIHSKYIDNNNFQLKQPNKSPNENDRWRSRSFLDSSEFYPEPNNRTITMHEKMLKIKAIDEQANDLSTLKQILEVLQLKGLIRSENSHRNFMYDRNLHFNESDIVLVKPSPLKRDSHRFRGSRRHVSENSQVRVRAASPKRIESNLKACNSVNKVSSKRNGLRNQKVTESLSVNRRRQKFVTEDESSSINESKFSTPSTTDLERSKGTSSLRRCEKLLTETKSATESPPSSAIVLPNPVSVLDSGFEKDEPLTRSHRVDLKGNISYSTRLVYYVFMFYVYHALSSTEREEFTSDDVDFIYISKIIRATQHFQEDPNVFLSLEKQLYNTKNTSNVSKRQRKLIFDVVLEIINRNVKLPPWKQVIDYSRALLKHVWFEFQKIREVNTGDGVLELVSGVIEKDLVEIYDWRDYPIETSELVLDIERMIFKDLVSEVIREMIEISGEFRFLKARRKLVF